MKISYPILLTISYLFFIMSNIMILFFNLELGLKFNATISIFADLFFLGYLWCPDEN
ncbi:MAG: hypothetical protein RCH30_3390 [Candidatus Phytoplasma australasiaticum]|uniref:Uncharacterized protein n=1 Tax=Candidatus Phytoplasma australasiaticum subsp. australasiaticum TaxID=2832407 RepID=A0AAP4X8Q7_9MOLU|nr:hypothetical protein [Candidatus Phytoplasma australasiaticum]QLL36855.1 hypothetical protein EPWB_v2c2490 ['Echinacea purpurea' witches'-broom phytoplasma]WKV64103.1 MAG: hypothetical protein NCHU2022_c2500 [Candidatus Phytoplasma australasiaticum]WMW50225.1 MAG: hypothetical protein RCH30_3390 [Candidatus Phytoplasma australasiaticum]